MEGTTTLSDRFIYTRSVVYLGYAARVVN